MKVFGVSIGAGQGGSLWPALLLLFLAVLAPSACVLWFLHEAIGGQQLAVQQKLRDAYRGQLEELQRRLAQRWTALAEQMTTTAHGLKPAESFAAAVRSGQVDGVIVLDSKGQVAYPDQTPIPAAVQPKDPPAWLEAQQQEQQHDFTAAAVTYGSLAASEPDANLAARACQAQIRSSWRAGAGERALSIVVEKLGQPPLDQAVDSTGRLIVADAELLCLELLSERGDPRLHEVETRLRGRLENYSHSALSAPQRRFLMRQLESLRPDAAKFATLAAESLAAEYISARSKPDTQPGLRASGLATTWQFIGRDRTLLLLVGSELVGRTFRDAADDLRLPSDVSINLLSPDQQLAASDAFLTLPGGADFPGWTLALALQGEQPFDQAAKQQVAYLLWVGALSIAAIVVLACLLALLLRRQFRRAQLKNDLVATVSHELKTPLASMRLLIDTLLDTDRLDEAQTRDYLRLASAENERLSRLIDSFLTFSRMQRGKHQLHLERTTAGKLVAAVQAAADERLGTAACPLQVEVHASDAPLMADSDAMVTALLNLLDNAYKYTGVDKRVALRSFLDNGSVCFAVEDNGVGLSPRAARRVFDRFYQVDQNLSRSRSGCGLGLAIVRSIVLAHHGEVDVTSQPNRGSKFTIRLPQDR